MSDSDSAPQNYIVGIYVYGVIYSQARRKKDIIWPAAYCLEWLWLGQYISYAWVVRSISAKSLMCLMKTKWWHHHLFIKCYQCITVSGTEERFNITRAILKCKYTREHNLHGLFLWKAQYTFSVCLSVWSLVASIQYYVHLILWFGRPKPIWNWKTDRQNERIGDFYNALLKVTILSVMNENCLPRARCASTAS